MENPLWGYIFRPPKDKRALIELLKDLPVFEDLSTTELLQISRVLHQRQYKKGDVVFNEEEPGAGLYIIQEGEIIITKEIAGGEQIELARLVDRNFFGEMALLVEMPRSATAVANIDSLLLAFCKPDFEKLIERNPRLGVKIMSNLSRMISQRLVKTNETLESLQNEVNRLTAGKKKG